MTFVITWLTEETEFRPNSSSAPAFTPIGQREMNTLCMDARTIGIKCWDRDLSRYLLSTRIPSYHPLQLYMKELPEWDGHDRLTDLAQRVSTSPIWIKSFQHLDAGSCSSRDRKEQVLQIV